MIGGPLMRISIASGKGGTGKTTIAVNLAIAAYYRMAGESARGLTGECSRGSENQMETRVQVLDCDVEEPNCHIFLKPEIEEKQEVTVPVPEVDEDKCTYCGACGDVCAFHAIMPGKHMVLVFPELCHGCGACSLLCPSKAIVEVPRLVGILESGYVDVGKLAKTGLHSSHIDSGNNDLSGRDRSLSSGDLSRSNDLLDDPESAAGYSVNRIRFTYGILNPGEALAPPVISQVKRTAENDSLVIIDTPPGTSCSMVESVRDTDFCLLVTEPTPFGLHDLELAVDTVGKLGVPCGVVTNRCDLGDLRVKEFCADKGIPVLLEIPLDRKIAELYAKGIPLVIGSEDYLQKFWDLLKATSKLAQSAASQVARGNSKAQPKNNPWSRSYLDTKEEGGL
jgi:MinD superfamily P-loop ATPase